MPRARLSVALITKNESEKIEKCLRSVEWADEIVIVDSGSTDDTLEKAAHFTDKIFVETDWQGFGPQRRRAHARATGDWVLTIDADERVTPELKEEILCVLKEDDRSKVFEFPHLTWCFGSFIRHSGWYPNYVLRLYPRDKAQYNEALVHEKLEVETSMETVRLKGDLLHFTYRNLEQWICKTGIYAAAWAKERERKGKKSSLFKGITHGLAGFGKAYFLRAGFLDGRQGLLLAILAAYSKFLKYADLWLRSQPKSPEL